MREISAEDAGRKALATPLTKKKSMRANQRSAAKKILRAADRGSGTNLTDEEAFSIWCAFMDFWPEMAAEDDDQP